MRGKANYLVDVHHEESKERLTYGPYTHKQALATVKKIDAFYRKEAIALDIDPSKVEFIVPHAYWYCVGKWTPPPMRSAPTRLPCPSCGVKLDVWTSDYGGGETHGVCNNRECDDYQKVDYILEEQDREWVITNHGE